MTSAISRIGRVTQVLEVVRKNPQQTKKQKDGPAFKEVLAEAIARQNSSESDLNKSA